MKQTGYAVVKITKKSITLCLFNESESDLEWACDACGFKGTEVLPFFEDANKNTFVCKNNEMIKV